MQGEISKERNREQGMAKRKETDSATQKIRDGKEAEHLFHTFIVSTHENSPIYFWTTNLLSLVTIEELTSFSISSSLL